MTACFWGKQTAKAFTLPGPYLWQGAQGTQVLLC